MKKLFKEIVFCTDFSENANEAFQVAKDLAVQYGANLHIVHVLVTLTSPEPDFFMSSETASEKGGGQSAQDLMENLYVKELPKDQKADIHFLSGYPATEIIQLAKEKQADLIVMGARGETGLTHVLFGSIADRVVRKAPCSVLAVRPFEE